MNLATSVSYITTSATDGSNMFSPEVMTRSPAYSRRTLLSMQNNVLDMIKCKAGRSLIYAYMLVNYIARSLLNWTALSL